MTYTARRNLAGRTGRRRAVMTRCNPSSASHVILIRLHVPRICEDVAVSQSQGAAPQGSQQARAPARSGARNNHDRSNEGEKEMRCTKIKIGTAVIAGIAALALAGCESTSGTTASQSSSPDSPAATASAPPTTYTAAQQKFIADMIARYGLGDGTSSSSSDAGDVT